MTEEQKSAITTAAEAAVAAIEDPAISAKGEIYRLLRWIGELKFANPEAERGAAARIRETVAAVREHLASGKYETAVALARSFASDVQMLSHTPAPKDPARDSDQVARGLHALRWYGVEIDHLTALMNDEGARVTGLTVQGVTVEKRGAKEYLSRLRIRELARPVTVEAEFWFRQFAPIPGTSANERPHMRVDNGDN